MDYYESSQYHVPFGNDLRPSEETELIYIFDNISSMTKGDLKIHLDNVSNRGRSDWAREYQGRGSWGMQSPLMAALQNKRQDLVEVMVKRFGLRIDSSFDHDGFPVTPSSPTQTVPLTKASVLSYAAAGGFAPGEDEDQVRFLFYEMKAKVNININGTTPLIAAICSHSRNLSMVKLLVEELKADVNFRASINRDGSNPYLALHAAIAVE